MSQDIFDWILLLVRWLHITVAVTWIGTSIFFMWLDRSFEVNPQSTKAGHVGEVWMVHGGGFYHVEKLQMGPTKVPDRLHWFKWESYWTWISGFILTALIFYTGDGTFLMDSMVSNISFKQALFLGLFSIFGSWFFYDFLWESQFVKKYPLGGHIFTISWVVGMTYLLTHTLSGRAAYLHVGAMLGTWMTANVFMRIIPRQIKMVEASKKGESVNQEWGKNAKNRSTHNTYFTLPVIFIMLSNHFPNTYGHESNWIILLLICAAGAAIREYFVVRLSHPKRSVSFGAIGLVLLTGVISFTHLTNGDEKIESHEVVEKLVIEDFPKVNHQRDQSKMLQQDASQDSREVKGVVIFEGTPPLGKKLNLPSGCTQPGQGEVYSNEVIVTNTRLQNVLVRVIKGHEKLPAFAVPEEEVLLDQKGCMYTPRVAAARVGQKVTFINSDPIFHNVRSVTKLNQRFNVAMPKKDQRITKVFTRPELFLEAKCSVHPWMGAYVAVMDHPYFSVSNKQGEFILPKLPPGTYTIEAWHEVFGTLIKEITIKGDEELEIQFIFQGKQP